MSLKRKKVLITGGLGFIGSNLKKKLEGYGAVVSIYDIGVGDDITDEKKVSETIKKKFDTVYHLAGFSGTATNTQEKIKFFNVNTLGTTILIEAIVKYSPKTKLIISSSRLEYGKPQYLPVDENHPTVPTSAYGLSKLLATQIAQTYHRTNNLDVVIFRTSNVYGPHAAQTFSGYNIINHFIDLALQNKSLTIYGQGEQQRDYLYIADLIQAFLLALTPRSAGQIYNLGYGQGIKFKDMAKLIVKKAGRGKIKLVNWPKDFKAVETGSYISDISKIKKELGFVPKVDFEEGILRTINSKQ